MLILLIKIIIISVIIMIIAIVVILVALELHIYCIFLSYDNIKQKYYLAKLILGHFSHFQSPVAKLKVGLFFLAF